MKLNSLYIVAFGAALASVEAAPLRLLTTSNEEVARGLRFGHAVAPFPVRNVPQVEARTVSVSAPNRSPCFMRKMAMEAIKISNSFRKAVGLPLIESSKPPVALEMHLPVDKHGKGPAYSILPFIGTPPTFVEIKDNGRGGSVVYTKGGDPVRVFGPNGREINLSGDPTDHPDHPGHPDHHPHPPHHPQHGHHGHHPHHGHKHNRPYRFCRHSPFWRRLTFALMSLGKWEGRAVAFVLGCGLGVLLRMLWVFSVITYRTFNGRREEVEYTVIHEYIDTAETPVAPPTYTYVDEKAEAKREETPAVAPVAPTA